MNYLPRLPKQAVQHLLMVALTATGIIGCTFSQADQTKMIQRTNAVAVTYDPLSYFVTAYNTARFDKIYYLFDDAMQAAMPRQQSEQYFVQLHQDLGQIRSVTQHTDSLYYLDFDRGSLAMVATFDSQHGRIVQLTFLPDHRAVWIETAEFDTPLGEEMAHLLTHFADHSQLAVAVLDGDEVRFLGAQRRDSRIRAYDNRHALFEIGSLTKVFAATALAGMAVKSSLNLAQPLHTYHPQLASSPAINLESLANHTSGLPRLPSDFMQGADPADPYRHYSAQRLENYLAMLTPPTPKQYAYSNLGYGLLGYTLAKMDHSTPQQVIQSRVLDVYQLHDSYVAPEHTPQDRLVASYDHTGQVVPNWHFDALFAAGGLVSSSSDLAKFAQAQFGDDPVLKLTHQPTTTDVALGWHRHSDPNWLWHNGQTGGYTSFMAINPSDRQAVIILSNLQGIAANELIDALGFDWIAGKYRTYP